MWTRQPTTEKSQRLPCCAVRFALLTMLALLSGCGASGQLETAPVAGKVTLDGKPVSKGMVVFTPKQGRGGQGVIAQDGTFRLTTYSTDDGAILGNHKIAVVAFEGLGEDHVKALVPDKYLAPDTSGLTYEVKPGSVNEVQLTLTSK